MALEPQELDMIREIKDEVGKIKKILLGNGEIGLCETSRDQTQAISKLSVRIRAVEETVTPLDKEAQRKQMFKDLAKTIATVLITATPIVISTLIYVHKLMAAIEKVVPLSTLNPK